MKTKKLLSFGTALLIAFGSFALTSETLAEANKATDHVAIATVQNGQSRGSKGQHRDNPANGQVAITGQKGNRGGKGMDYSAYSRINIDDATALNEDEKALLKADLANASSLLTELEGVKTSLSEARTKLKEAQKANSADLASLQATYDALQAKYVELSTSLKSIFDTNATIWAKIGFGGKGMKNANRDGNPQLAPAQATTGMGKNKNHGNAEGKAVGMNMPDGQGRGDRCNGRMGNEQDVVGGDGNTTPVNGNRGNTGGRGGNSNRRNNGVQPVEAPAGFGTSTNP